MKLDKVKSLDELDAKFGMSDPFELIIGDDDDGKKHKKKHKAKDKDKSEKKSKRDSTDDALEELSLKEMSKSQLRKRIERMGIDTTDIDMDSKKSMRKAIKAAREMAKLSKGGLSPKSRELISDKAYNPPALPVKNAPAGLVQVTTRPPHYVDEDTGDFVVTKALERKDLEVYQAMQSLGVLRRERRPDDGFGEMMNRIDKAIKRNGLDDKETIDVPNLVERKAPKELPAATEEVIVLEPHEVEKMSNDVDRAIEQLHRSTEQLAQARANNGGKSKNKGNPKK